MSNYQSHLLDTIAPGTSQSFSFTIPTGTSRVLIVLIAINTAAAGTGMIATAITYNGVSLTEHGTPYIHNNRSIVQVWYLVNPPEGAHTVAVTYGSSAGGKRSAIAIAFDDAYQGGNPCGNRTNSGSNNGSAPSVNVASATGETVVDVVQVRNTTANPTATVGAGQTERVNQAYDAAEHLVLFSTEPGAATVTMSWSLSANSNFAITGCSIKTAVAASGNDYHKRISESALTQKAA